MYAVCLRHLLLGFPPNDWRVVGTQQLNDDHAGDILEAIWGLLWNRHEKTFLAAVVPEIPTETLEKYCDKMTRVVLMFVDLCPNYLKPSEWPDSKVMADALC